MKADFKCKCGGEAIWEHGEGGMFICCLECEKQTNTQPEHEELKAIREWNNLQVKDNE